MIYFTGSNDTGWFKDFFLNGVGRGLRGIRGIRIFEINNVEHSQERPCSLVQMKFMKSGAVQEYENCFGKW